MITIPVVHLGIATVLVVASFVVMDMAVRNSRNAVRLAQRLESVRNIYRDALSFYAMNGDNGDRARQALWDGENHEEKM